MKHIFLIHSHITREVAWAIIRREGIALSDVVFVLDRKFEALEKDIKVVSLDLPDECFLIYKNPLRGWRYLWRINKFIDGLSTKDFSCYLPHTYFNFAGMMTSHPRCKGYSLMEEGLWSYFGVKQMNEVVPPALLSWKQRLLSRVFYLGKFRDRFFCVNDTVPVYCTSPQAFPGFATKKVIDLRNQINAGEVKSSENLSIRKVIVLDSVVETKVVTESEFMSGFEGLMRRLMGRLNKGEVIYIKRHPYQYVKHEFSDRLIAFLRARLPANEVRELGADVSMEELALKGQVEFYLNVSSVSIYASRLGCKVYSYARSVGKGSPEFMRRLEGLPRAFHESVEFI